MTVNLASSAFAADALPQGYQPAAAEKTSEGKCGEGKCGASETGAKATKAINHYITTDINVHLKSFYRDTGLTLTQRKSSPEIIDQKIIRFAKNMFEYAQDHLILLFQRNFVYTDEFPYQFVFKTDPIRRKQLDAPCKHQKYGGRLSQRVCSR